MSDNSCWVDDLRRWHESRLRELNYPPEIFHRLSHDREFWLHSSGAVCCRDRKEVA
jgi:hypothetical protein